MAVSYDFARKSTIEDIRAGFDRSVERFSNRDTGQQSAIDSRLMMERLAAVAARTTPHARHVLDIGCGAGNYTLAVLDHLAQLECTLLDLSAPMLERARARIQAVTPATVTTRQGDIRDLDLGDAVFDVAITGSALHHLRGDAEWEQVFARIFRSLKPHGSFWISDLVTHEHPGVEAEMRNVYGAYLTDQQGPEFREAVFANIEREDTPRSVTYQLNLLGQVGFRDIDVIHKNACFALFGGVKP